MSEHVATLEWALGDSDFGYQNYSRNHLWGFGQDVSLKASAAPEYLGDEEFVDPEQAFVAAVASCHMLTFLSIASRKKLKVIRYSDTATGWLEKNDQGRLSITRVELKPDIEFEQGLEVDATIIDKIHHLSHQECFIANSVNTDIKVVS